MLSLVTPFTAALTIAPLRVPTSAPRAAVNMVAAPAPEKVAVSAFAGHVHGQPRAALQIFHLPFTLT